MFILRGITVSVEDLGAPHLRLEAAPGIHVLYGLNGVGKTRILKSIPQGTFALHAPLRAGKYWGPLWLIRTGWSFGHEHELEWPFKDDLIHSGVSQSWQSPEVVDLVNNDPDSLLEVLDDLQQLVLDAASGNESSDLPFQWTARLAYWLARIHWLDNEGVRLVGEAILEFIEQGDVVVRPLGPSNGGTPRSWSVTHYATITPDSPRLYAWQQWAAGAIQDVAYKNWSEKSSYHWEDCVGEPSWESRQSRLIPDAAAAAVPPPHGAEPFEPQGPRFEVFSRTIDFAEVHGPWQGFSPIVFITDDLDRLDDESMVFLRRVIDTSEDFASTQPPSEHVSDPSRETALDEFMFGSTASPRIHPSVHRFADELGDRASNEFARLLSTATPLRVRMVDPGEWAAYGRVRWESMDRRGEWVPLTDLSDTQRRLATLSIRIAMHAPSDAVSVLLIDEPERGLHRIAERHLVAGLDQLTRRYPDLVVIVASHSPSFLRPDIATLHHVERDSEGVVQLNRMPAISTRDLTKLGMTASDLLQLTRIVVLVEGQHDEWVLQHTFGSDFAERGIKVMSMRGATKLVSAADGTLLFDYTEAHLVVVLDKITTERINQHWNKALVSWNEHHDLNEVIEILKNLLPSARKGADRLNGKTEGEALKEFCTAVIARGRHDRVSFHGMSKDDIEDYYSPKFFTSRVNPPETFELLRRDWRKLRDAGETTGNFKEWARREHEMSFSSRNFKRAVQNSELPDDFQALYQHLSNLSDLLD